MGGMPVKKFGLQIFVLLLVLLYYPSPSCGDTSPESSPGQETNITAAEVAAKYVQAIGGIAALKKVAAKKIRYRVHMFSRDGYLMERRWKRPAVMRQGSPDADTYMLTEGAKSWQVTPDGRKEMPAPVAANFAKIADFDGPLVDYEKKGIQIEYVGSERYDMSELHHLKLTFKDGVEWALFFDARTGLLRKMKQPSFFMTNSEIKRGPDTWTYFYDYRQVNNLKFAHLWVQVADDHVHSFVVEEVLTE